MRLLHGRPLAERLAARSRERSAALLGRGIHPALTVISVGIDSAANTYLLRLVRGGEALDITVRDASLHRDATEQAVSAELDRASRDPAVHGVLLLTPLPGKLDEGQLVDHIAAQKDVEGVNPYNVGLAQGGRQRFVPSTAEAIVELLKFHDIPLAGADVVMVCEGVNRFVFSIMARADLKRVAELKGKKIGSSWRIGRSSIDEFLRS